MYCRRCALRCVVLLLAADPVGDGAPAVVVPPVLAPATLLELFPPTTGLLVFVVVFAVAGLLFALVLAVPSNDVSIAPRGVEIAAEFVTTAPAPPAAPVPVVVVLADPSPLSLLERREDRRLSL